MTSTETIRAKRQAEFLEAIVEMIRASATYPDLRFGQLLVNAMRMHDSHGDDVFRLFNAEGAVIAKALREYADKAQAVASDVAAVLPTTRSCHLHDDCDADDADRISRTGKPSLHCNGVTCGHQ